jgi:hypothetical protein
MIYARVHDQTVADDYYAAMQQIEKRMDLLGVQQEASIPISNDERTQLLALTMKLEQPELNLETKQSIVTQMRDVLNRKEAAPSGVLTPPTRAFLEVVNV